jgi:hypothetical protein
MEKSQRTTRVGQTFCPTVTASRFETAWSLVRAVLKQSQKRRTRMSDPHKLLRDRVRLAFGSQPTKSLLRVGCIRSVRKDFQVRPIISDRLG